MPERNLPKWDIRIENLRDRASAGEHERTTQDTRRDALRAGVGILRREASEGPELPRLVRSAASHDSHNLPDRVNVRDGIAVYDDEVGDLASFDRAELFVSLHHPRWHDGRRLNRFHRRESVLDVDLEL